MSHQILYKRNQFLKKFQGNDTQELKGIKDIANDSNDDDIMNKQKLLNKVVDKCINNNGNQNVIDNKFDYFLNEDIKANPIGNNTMLKNKLIYETKSQQEDPIAKMKSLIKNHDQNIFIRRSINKTYRDESSASKSNDTNTPEKSTDRYSVKISPVKPILLDAFKEQLNPIFINSSAIHRNNHSYDNSHCAIDDASNNSNSKITNRNNNQDYISIIDTDSMQNKSFESRLKRFNNNKLIKLKDMPFDPMFCAAKPKPPNSNSKNGSSVDSSDIDGLNKSSSRLVNKTKLNDSHYENHVIETSKFYLLNSDKKYDRVVGGRSGIGVGSGLGSGATIGIGAGIGLTGVITKANRRIKIPSNQIIFNSPKNDSESMSHISIGPGGAGAGINIKDEIKPLLREKNNNENIITEIFDKDIIKSESKSSKRSLMPQLPKPLLDLNVCLSPMDSTERGMNKDERSYSNSNSSLKSGSHYLGKKILNKEIIDKIKEQMKKKILGQTGVNGNSMMAPPLPMVAAPTGRATESGRGMESGRVIESGRWIESSRGIESGRAIETGRIIEATGASFDEKHTTDILDQYSRAHDNGINVTKNTSLIRSNEQKELQTSINDNNNNMEPGSSSKSRLSYKVISEKYFDNTVHKLQKVQNLFTVFKKKQEQLDQHLNYKTIQPRFPNQTSSNHLNQSFNFPKSNIVNNSQLEDKALDTCACQRNSYTCSTHQKYTILCAKNTKISLNMLWRIFKRRLRYAYFKLYAQNHQERISISLNGNSGLGILRNSISDHKKTFFK